MTFTLRVPASDVNELHTEDNGTLPHRRKEFNITPVTATLAPRSSQGIKVENFKCTSNWTPRKNLVQIAMKYLKIFIDWVDINYSEEAHRVFGRWCRRCWKGDSIFANAGKVSFVTCSIHNGFCVRERGRGRQGSLLVWLHFGGYLLPYHHTYLFNFAHSGFH